MFEQPKIKGTVCVISSISMTYHSNKVESEALPPSHPSLLMCKDTCKYDTVPPQNWSQIKSQPPLDFFYLQTTQNHPCTSSSSSFTLPLDSFDFVYGPYRAYG
jgi:hypothetical protein